MVEGIGAGYRIVRNPGKGIVLITISDELGDDDTDCIQLRFERQTGSLVVTGRYDGFEHVISEDIQIPLSEIRSILHEME